MVKIIPNCGSLLGNFPKSDVANVNRKPKTAFFIKFSNVFLFENSYLKEAYRLNIHDCLLPFLQLKFIQLYGVSPYMRPRISIEAPLALEQFGVFSPCQENSILLKYSEVKSSLSDIVNINLYVLNFLAFSQKFLMEVILPFFR